MSLVSAVLKASKEADEYYPHRTRDYIVKSAMSEMGECTIELAIEQGESYKKAGPDGVVGEAIDVIACMLDLIYKSNPNITEEELEQIATKKVAKWIDKLQQHYR